MTQLRTRSTLSLRVLSSQEVVVLVPGHPHTITVQIENGSDRPLPYRLQLSGDIPPDWCQLGLSSSADIAPQSQVAQAFCIEVPADFFEAQAALRPQETVLKLNYQVNIALYRGTVQRPDQTVEEALLDLRRIPVQIQPQTPYFKFLPAIYQSSDFIGRFLAIIEQAFDPTVQTLDTLWAYLDPLTAPAALLPFLARWVAWPLDPRWTLPQQRRLLRHAITLYRWRGTSYGLRLYLHLYTNLPLDDDTVPEVQKRISVVENHRASFVVGHAQLDQAHMLGGGRPFHFTVTLRPETGTDLNEALIRDVIEQVKPAHCTYDLDIAE